MSTPATIIVPVQRSMTADPANAAIGRGLRCVMQSNGYLALAGIGVRGDYISLQVLTPGEPGLVAPINCGGSLALYTATSANVADLTYSAANGQVSATSTSAVLVGKWLQAPVASTLAVAELIPIQ